MPKVVTLITLYICCDTSHNKDGGDVFIFYKIWKESHKGRRNGGGISALER